MKRWLRLILLLLTGSLAACSKVQGAFPAPAETPIALYAAPAPTPQAKGFTLDEYVEWRFSQVRWVKAPTPEEVQTLRESLRAEALRLDKNGDGVIDPWELQDR